MVIGWRQFDNVQSNFRQAGYAYTTDEGRHWRFPGVLTPGVFRSDPVLTSDAEGRIGYLSLGSDSLADFFDLEYFRSFDGGLTFPTSAPAYGGDKEWGAVDRTASVGHDNVYAFYTPNSGQFTRSTDAGGSFSFPAAISGRPRWGTVTVAPNGDLDIAGADANYFNFVFSKRGRPLRDLGWQGRPRTRGSARTLFLPVDRGGAQPGAPHGTHEMIWGAQPQSPRP